MPAISQSHEQRLALLERDVATLKQSIDALQGNHTAPDNGLKLWVDEGRAQPNAILSQEQLDCILRLTKAMFGDEVSVEVESDPEWPDESFVVFLVAASGELQDLLEKQHQWHREVAEVVESKTELIRISIAPGHGWWQFLH
jgi:hypothetical protein